MFILSSLIAPSSMMCVSCNK